MPNTTDRKELEDSRSAILNVLEDYRQGAEDISNSRSAILNVLDDQRQGAEDISNSRSAILNVLEDYRQGAEDVSNSRSAILNVLEDLGVSKAALEQEKAALLAIGDGAVTTDATGKITFANKIFEDLLGWKLEEVKAQDLGEIMPMEDEDGKAILPNQQPMVLALLTGKKSTTTTYLVQKDKKRFPAALTATPILLEGKTTGAILVFRDITKEKEVDKAKTEFVSLASHQLRTPLSTVNWYTEMLLAGDAGKLNDEQKKYLDQVYKGNQRMVALVNALLNVSRLELGTFTVEPEPTDIVKLVQSAIDEQRIQIDQKKLKLGERYADNLPLLNADPKLLAMVFQNLLSNAVKYTPDKGTISLDLRLVKRGEFVDKQKMNEDGIAIVISDTGWGIPKRQQDKIFTKLFRADNVREKDTEGTGLGLYIVKAIVDHSGGMIWFLSPGELASGEESEENQGTTCYVILPLTGMKKKEGTKALS